VNSKVTTLLRLLGAKPILLDLMHFLPATATSAKACKL
jgi:uncharacterized damage-inducible protein DinB